MARLIGYISSPLLLGLGLVPDVMLWARRVACCWQFPPPFIRPSVDFFKTLEVALDDGALSWLPTQYACATHSAAFFPPPRGTNLGILGYVGPPGETGRDAATDG